MQKLGITLVTAGFLAGALFASLDKDSVPWGAFVPAWLVACAGVAVLRIGARRQATDRSLLESNVRDIERSIARITEHSRELADADWGADVYDLPDEIDRRFPEPVARFVQARESIRYVHGVDAYAEIMSEFAAGERYLNRVWSASAEGYVDEANTYLEKAHHQFHLAKTRLDTLRTTAPPT